MEAEIAAYKAMSMVLNRIALGINDGSIRNKSELESFVEDLINRVIETGSNETGIEPELLKEKFSNQVECLRALGRFSQKYLPSATMN